MRISSIIVTAQPIAREIVQRLITASCWFTLTPLPDDCWEIVVKEDQGRTLLLAFDQAMEVRDGLVVPLTQAALLAARDALLRASAEMGDLGQEFEGLHAMWQQGGEGFDALHVVTAALQGEG